MEIEIDIDIINALYNEYNEYVSEDGENDIEEEAIVSDEEDRNYKHNDNMNDDAYNLDVNKVDKKIKLDTTQLYQNIFDNFDNVYADDIDNILEQNPVINIEMNHNIIDKNDDHIIEEHEGGNIQQNGDDDDDEYIEQSEGHIEVIDDKTYIFPSGYKNIGPVFSYGKQWSSDIQPKYKHLKEEVLNNKYAPITEKTWNAILRKCNKILKGEFTSKKRITWSKLLKANKIGIKHLVALKLYTDFDLLQREFRKSFRAPFNKTKERLQAFFHWNKALQETFKKFSVIKRHSAIRQPHRLFHGVNSIMCLDQYEGVYYGPCSTTTDLQVARSFAGKNGMILVLKPETNTTRAKYKVLDISWISDYPDEREYLLFNHKIEIETWILSSDFDEYHHYYMNTLAKDQIITGPSGHRSYQDQKEIPKHLTKLALLIDEVEIKSNKSSEIKIKKNVEFKKDVLNEKEKLDVLIWIFKFAMAYKYGKKKASKFDQSLNANLQHVMKTVHIMHVPPKLVTILMQKLTEHYEDDISAYFISQILNKYFINTYCRLNPAI